MQNVARAGLSGDFGAETVKRWQSAKIAAGSGSKQREPEVSKSWVVDYKSPEKEWGLGRREEILRSSQTLLLRCSYY